jgi:hypothetical protein
MSYMFPRMADALTLPCQPCSGPRQLKFGDYKLVVTILRVFGMAWHVSISGTTPSFITKSFAHDLSGNYLGAPKVC